MSGDVSPAKKPLFPRLYGEGRYFFLLVSLLLLFFIYPFFDGFRIAPGLLSGFFLAILLSAVSSISASRRWVAAASVLAAVAFGSYILAQLYETAILRGLTMISFALFFLLITVVILRHILSTRKVTFDTILGTICAYLVLGMVWTMVYALMEMFAPESFLHGGIPISVGFADSREGAISNFIYYSFVTLTTLGYGDITPNTSPAAAMSALEAVTGQLYLAILIARFVGLHIASAGREEKG